MERISNVWFEGERIWIKTTEGKTYSRPLEAFPTLKLASNEQRNNYELVAKGQFIHWRELDEDIDVESFYEMTEPHYDNEIARMFEADPYIDVKSVADAMNVHYSLLYKYIYGMVKPSPKRREQLLAALNTSISAVAV